MTRRHFEAIARSFAANHAEFSHQKNFDALAAIERQARDLADIFENENPRFDSDRFLTACGIDV